MLILTGYEANGLTRINAWTQSHSTNSSMKLACYLSFNTNDFKSNLTKYLEPTLCTHILYFGSGISPDCEITTDPSTQVMDYLQSLKKSNPSLKILNTNSGNFDYVLGSEANRTRFVKSVVPFLQKYSFDGIDMDWEYPGLNKPFGQIHNFSLLLEELRSVFSKESLLTGADPLMITMAVTGWRLLMDVLYEYEYIEKNVDFVSIMGYDYNGFSVSTPFTGYNSPLYGIPNEIFFLKDRYLIWSANEWAKKLPKHKILVGAPSYTRAFTLVDPSRHANRDPASGKGHCDEGYLICACQALKIMNGTRVFDNQTKVPYVYYKDQWISYEDIESMTLKANWVKENSFAGMMLFILNADDYDAYCDGKTRFPITSTISKIIVKNGGR